jgi:hypothetical protein
MLSLAVTLIVLWLIMYAYIKQNTFLNTLRKILSLSEINAFFITFLFALFLCLLCQFCGMYVCMYMCVHVCIYVCIFLFNLLHVPLMEAILQVLFHIYSYNTVLSSSYMCCYILWWLNYLNILMSLVSSSKEILLINLING